MGLVVLKARRAVLLLGAPQICRLSPTCSPLFCSVISVWTRFLCPEVH